MRVAVISDIHGNLHALDAVIEALEQETLGAVWCLGDLVGYGPRPNDCCTKVAARADICLAGNHDLGVLGELPLDDFSHEAAESALWTRDVLEQQAREYLEGLESSTTLDDPPVGLYHASPRDPIWEYVLDVFSMRASLEDTTTPLVLVGHSHVPLLGELVDGRLRAEHAPDGTQVDLAAGRLLLNPGSVGQPRDGDPRAAYLVLDLDAQTASFHRVEYPVEQTQAEIRELGLPEPLAERLKHGV
jgi:predicted phosphodiesterase